MQVAVFTVDQRASRSGHDRVPELLQRLAAHRMTLPFERTVGDEIQALTTDPTRVAEVAETLLRTGGWNVGIGLGEAEEPLPEHSREGRGSAYLHAREAVTAAKRSPWHVCVRGESPQAARALESALWLWADLLHRRSSKGWAVVDLLDSGLTQEEAARRLGITQSAVTQRARAAGLVEGRRAGELTGHLAGQALGVAS